MPPFNIVDITNEISQPYLNITCALGEGPFYDAKSNTLRFVDIIRKELHTVNLEQGPGSHAVLKLKDSVGFVLPIVIHAAVLHPLIILHGMIRDSPRIIQCHGERK